jgi:hypothetical protein
MDDPARAWTAFHRTSELTFAIRSASLIPSSWQIGILSLEVPHIHPTE